MISNLLKRDLKKIIAKDSNANITIFRTQEEHKCFFFKETKIFYDDGLSGTSPTILIDDDADVKIRDEIQVNFLENILSFIVHKIEYESQALKRLYLKDL